MAESYFHRVKRETATRFWINNPTAADMEKSIAAGAVSCTTNPSYCAKLLQSEPDYIRGVIDSVVLKEKNTDAAATGVYHAAARRIMDKFMPLFAASGGRDGYVTVQDDPRRDYDADHTVRVHLDAAKMGKNYMAKIPVISGGNEAIEELAARNVPVCATEVFAVAQAVHICERYARAAKRTGNHPPLYVTHITGIFDQYFADLVKTGKIDIDPAILAQAGTVIGRREYKVLKERGFEGLLLGGGARGIGHFTEFVGGDMHITINWSTAEELVAKNPPIENRIDAPTPAEVVQELSAKLPGFRRAYDADGMEPGEFADFGPVMLFKTMFLNGYIRLLDEIIERRGLAG